MAAVATPPTFAHSGLRTNDSLSASEDYVRAKSLPGSTHPDVNSEIAALSNKLISAINHQTSLDDALTTTREELDAVQQCLKHAEGKNEDYVRLLASGDLVERSELEGQTNSLMAQLSEEKRCRALAEKEKNSMEQELENLTTALFEEANGVSLLQNSRLRY